MVPKNRCLLAWHAHPDDESSKGAGTMAKYSADGTRVVLVCATRGEAGDILNPRMDRPGIKEKLPEIRVAELETACDLLGVDRVYHLGYRDSGMRGTGANSHADAFCNADRDEVVRRLVEIIRAERPDVVLSYDEARGYDHPDHVRVHETGLLAFEAAGDPQRWPEAGAPWRPGKLYYFASFTRRRLMALHEAALAEGITSPYAEFVDDWEKRGFTEPEITTQIDVTEYIELRAKALLAHATQIDPDSAWFAIPSEVERRAYPWEDYTLARAHVDVSPLETDLFAGIEDAHRGGREP